MKTVHSVTSPNAHWLQPLARLSMRGRSSYWHPGSDNVRKRLTTDLEASRYWGDVMESLSAQCQLWLLAEQEEALAAVMLHLDSSGPRLDGMVTSELQLGYGGLLANHVGQFVWGMGIKEALRSDSDTRDLIFNCW